MSKKLCEACEIFGEVPDCTDCGETAEPTVSICGDGPFTSKEDKTNRSMEGGETQVVTGVRVQIDFKLGLAPDISRTFERSPAPDGGSILKANDFGFLEVDVSDLVTEFFALDTIARIVEELILDE